MAMGRPTLRACTGAVIVAALLGTGCAHTPRSFDESPATLAIRADYLGTHPAGPFNAQIARGEVGKGMSFLEVLAAWGVPEWRARTEDARFEVWGYVARDEGSQDWTRYTFTFEKKTLVEWETTRHVIKGHALAQWETREVPVWVEAPQPRSVDLTGARR